MAPNTAHRRGRACSGHPRLWFDARLKPRTLEAIQAAVEKAGVEFTNGDAPGVRLKKS
jgi:hypothetical protein